jgi:hypothetical protein
LGRSWAAPGVGQLVETVSSPAVKTFHEMAVSVHRDLNRGVSEAGLDGLGMLAGGDQPRGVSVSEVVRLADLESSLCYSISG